MLTASVPGVEIHYFGGQRTRELWQSESIIQRGLSIFGQRPADTIRLLHDFRFDLVINMEASEWAKCVASALSDEASYVVGPCLDDEGRADLPFASDARGDLWRDPNWSSIDLSSRYPFLESGFIAEILARLCYMAGPVPPYRLASHAPSYEIPDVLIAMSASLPEKLWSSEGWADSLGRLRERGMTVGLLGAKPGPQNRYWKGALDEQEIVDRSLAMDLRGTLTLTEVVGALELAKVVLTLDNGIMHLAGATQTPTIALFREGIHRLWTPPSGNIVPVVSEPGRPVAEIRPERVWRALCDAL